LGSFCTFCFQHTPPVGPNWVRFAHSAFGARLRPACSNPRSWASGPQIGFVLHNAFRHATCGRRKIWFVLHLFVHSSRLLSGAKQDMHPGRVCPRRARGQRRVRNHVVLPTTCACAIGAKGDCLDARPSDGDSRPDGHARALRVDHFRLPIQRQCRPPNSVTILQTPLLKVKRSSQNSTIRGTLRRASVPARPTPSRPTGFGHI
jgi:hypothetical protein